jgi:deoxyribodipyrimidine photolyase
LKNYLIALNEKLVVLNDLKKDFEQSQQKILTSEGARGDLQDHIQQTSVQIKDHATENKSFQDDLLASNSDLKTLIQQIEAKLAQAVKDHHAALAAREQQCLRREQEAENRMQTLKKDFEQRLQVAQAEKESSGSEFKMQITKLQTENETIKVKYAKDLKDASDKNAQLLKDI